MADKTQHSAFPWMFWAINEWHWKFQQLAPSYTCEEFRWKQTQTEFPGDFEVQFTALFHFHFHKSFLAGVWKEKALSAVEILGQKRKIRSYITIFQPPKCHLVFLFLMQKSEGTDMNYEARPVWHQNQLFLAKLRWCWGMTTLQPIPLAVNSQFSQSLTLNFLWWRARTSRAKGRSTVQI